MAFGQIIDGRISQVKGSTYPLDALIGNNSSPTSPSEILSSFSTLTITDEKEFASLNGITYSLEALIGEDKHSAKEHIADKKSKLVTAMTAKSPVADNLFFTWRPEIIIDFIHRPVGLLRKEDTLLV